jgi:hypothetical protein
MQTSNGKRRQQLAEAAKPYMKLWGKKNLITEENWRKCEDEMEKKKRKKRQQLAEAAKPCMKLCLKFVKKYYLTFKENCRNADTKWGKKKAMTGGSRNFVYEVEQLLVGLLIALKQGNSYSRKSGLQQILLRISLHSNVPR